MPLTKTIILRPACMTSLILKRTPASLGQPPKCDDCLLGAGALAVLYPSWMTGESLDSEAIRSREDIPARSSSRNPATRTSNLRTVLWYVSLARSGTRIDDCLCYKRIAPVYLCESFFGHDSLLRSLRPFGLTFWRRMLRAKLPA